MSDKTISEAELLKEFDEIQEEWRKHRVMNTCSVCDSPKGHTDMKDFVSKAFKAGEAQALEWVEKEVIGEDKPAYIIIKYYGGDFSKIDVKKLDKYFTKCMKKIEFSFKGVSVDLQRLERDLEFISDKSVKKINN